MKFLYFTDPHIRGTTPSSRKDDYKKSLLDKFRQIENIIRDQRVDAVLCGGDFFHQPEVSYSVLNEFLPQLQAWRRANPFVVANLSEEYVRIYTVVGSHDKIGYNTSSVYKGALGTLIEAGIVQVLEDDLPEIFTWYDPKKPTIQLSGVSHEFGNDTDPKRYRASRKEDVFKMIQICHGPIVKDSQRFPHIRTKDMEIEADVVLCGHIHDGFPMHKIMNTVFANPGSLGRIENTPANRQRTPAVVLIEITAEKSSIKEIPLNCKPGDEIFTEKEDSTDADVSQFLTELQNHVTNLQDLPYKEVVHKLGQDLQIEQAVLERTLTILDNVHAYEF